MNNCDDVKNIEDEGKGRHRMLWLFAILGAVLVIAGIAYAIYRYLTPDYVDDFDDEFDDDEFDDDEDDDIFVDEDK